MPKAIKEKQVCEKCGVDIRPDTQFCYNCGASVVGGIQHKIRSNDDAGENNGVAARSRESLSELESALAAEFPPVQDPKAKLEAAAAVRRRARKLLRKTVEVVWEPEPYTSDRLYLLVAILIFVFVAVTVYLVVLAK